MCSLRTPWIYRCMFKISAILTSRNGKPMKLFQPADLQKINCPVMYPIEPSCLILQNNSSVNQVHYQHYSGAGKHNRTRICHADWMFNTCSEAYLSKCASGFEVLWCYVTGGTRSPTSISRGILCVRTNMVYVGQGYVWLNVKHLICISTYAQMCLRIWGTLILCLREGQSFLLW